MIPRAESTADGTRDAATRARPSGMAALALLGALRPVRALHARGPASFLNLSFYSFGLTGMWTAVGSIVLPLMVSDMIARGPVLFLGFELQKNGAMSVIAIVAGAVVGLTQPLAGWLSDHTTGPLGKRLPYLAIGALGLVPLSIALGAVNTIIPVILLWAAAQFFGNLAQGPANALLLDHVPPRRLGAASGTLILTRAAGGGLIAATVLGLMSHYDAATSPAWLWAALGVAAAAVIITVSWTFTALRPVRLATGPPSPSSGAVAPAHGRSPTVRPSFRPGYGFFLLALTVIVAGMSAMSMYAVFYMQDMVAPENPPQALLLAVAIMVPTVALTVLPAGRLSDRVGRTRTLVGAGLIGAFGVLLLALFPSLPIVLVAAVPIAVSVATLFTVMWAFANDLVAPGSAARDLGFTGVSFLAGGVLARFAGFAVDALNAHSPNLGYRVLVFLIAAAFVLMPLALRRLSTR